MRRNHHLSRGFTLIEILLYVALSAIVSLAIVSASWNIIRLSEEGFWYQAAAADMSRATKRINVLIRNADSIEVPAPDRLELGLLGTSATIVITLESGRIVLDSGTPVPLTGDALAVTSLQFTSASPDNTDATMVSYDISGNSGFLGNLWYLSVHSGAEARGLFNQE
ncbi:MAG: prepilin-type N-terminal cleavage/methylation domain-containing protein [Candidatus Moraniibacteriota bacterium]|nr:MAG: prepilin-type N-terminal cleavage/methylation domain-containing protein [Candidatus Moranbacteria bacterium]